MTGKQYRSETLSADNKKTDRAKIDLIEGENCTYGALLILSVPPATTTLLSPVEMV
jgi:hypothetical protein